MSSYKEEIFDYFTKKDNFISAYEIYQEFPEVKNKLIEEFWATVISSLKVLTKNTNWKFNISENIFETYSGIDLFFNDDDSVWVRIQKLHENPYIGIRFDDCNKMLLKEVRDYFSSLGTIKLRPNDQWWLGLEETGDNFNNIETLKKILPDNREDFAQELAKMLFDFGEGLKKDIVKMCKMIKK